MWGKHAQAGPAGGSLLAAHGALFGQARRLHRPAPHQMRRGPVHMRLSLRARNHSDPILAIHSHPQHPPFINPDRAPTTSSHCTHPFYCTLHQHVFEHHPSLQPNNPSNQTATMSLKNGSSPQLIHALPRCPTLPSNPKRRAARALYRTRSHVTSELTPTSHHQTSSPRRSPSS